ncbi:MAG: hypothetical protein SGILL_010097 [Bacillariaceae sp.]
MSSDSTKNEIQVIVAGLGRTGTMSMEAALSTLGYKPYHFGAVPVEPGHCKLWRQRAEGEVDTKAVFDSITARGYNATMDSPMCDVYLEQVELYPDAKVVLTTHPKGAAGWAKSYINLMKFVQAQSTPFSIWYPNFMGWIPLIDDFNRIRNMIGVPVLGCKPGEMCYGLWDQKPSTEKWLEGLYEKHNAHVRKHVPSHQLLEYDVSQGWGPLCRFLGKPVPNEPFPHVNDSAAMKRNCKIVKAIVYGWIPVVACSLIGMAYGGKCAARMWRQQRR